MKRITIIIPTRNRLKKLLDCLDSIPVADNIFTMVCFDGDEGTYREFKKIWSKYDVRKQLSITAVLEPEHIGSVKCRNKMLTMCQDGVLYATDDIVFMPNSIQRAFEEFNNRFHDDDGVVGFVQLEADFHPTGVALVGQHFLLRYPFKQLFYPGYYHFSAQEIHWLAAKVGKFHQEPEAAVKHKHPCFYKEEHDKTHEDARIHKKRDMDLRNYRKEKGLIWGYESESCLQIQ